MQKIKFFLLIPMLFVAVLFTACGKDTPKTDLNNQTDNGIIVDETGGEEDIDLYRITVIGGTIVGHIMDDELMECEPEMLYEAGMVLAVVADDHNHFLWWDENGSVISHEYGFDYTVTGHATLTAFGEGRSIGFAIYFDGNQRSFMNNHQYPFNPETFQIMTVTSGLVFLDGAFLTEDGEIIAHGAEKFLTYDIASGVELGLAGGETWTGPVRCEYYLPRNTWVYAFWIYIDHDGAYKAKLLYGWERPEQADIITLPMGNELTFIIQQQYGR